MFDQIVARESETEFFKWSGYFPVGIGLNPSLCFTYCGMCTAQSISFVGATNITSRVTGVSERYANVLTTFMISHIYGCYFTVIAHDQNACSGISGIFIDYISYDSLAFKLMGPILLTCFTEIMAWISNYIHHFSVQCNYSAMSQHPMRFQHFPCLAWICKCIPYITLDVLICPCSNNSSFVLVKSATGNLLWNVDCRSHYNDVIMGAIASQINSLTLVYLILYSDADQRKKSKLRVTGLCAGNSPVNSPHKWPVTRKMFPFDDVIMAFWVSDNIVLTQYAFAVLFRFVYEPNWSLIF